MHDEMLFSLKMKGNTPATTWVNLMLSERRWSQRNKILYDSSEEVPEVVKCIETMVEWWWVG